MTDYREILRLKSLGLNRAQIADSLGASRTTVIHTLQRAAAQGLDWQTAEPLSDKELSARLLGQESGKPSYKMPDYEYIHREMSKPGVTQQLLWFEYCDQCRAAGEVPLTVNPVKTYYREYIAKTKATMHINRKPGELMEVDWAGQTTQITDADTGETIEVFFAMIIGINIHLDATVKVQKLSA